MRFCFLLRAYFQNGWHGQLARAGRRLADRNGRNRSKKIDAFLEKGHPSRSVGRVARQHRPVACATQIILKTRHRLFAAARTLKRELQPERWEQTFVKKEDSALFQFYTKRGQSGRVGN